MDSGTSMADYIYTSMAFQSAVRLIYVNYLLCAYLIISWRLRKRLVIIWPMGIYFWPSTGYELSFDCIIHCIIVFSCLHDLGMSWNNLKIYLPSFMMCQVIIMYEIAFFSVSLTPTH